MALYELLDRFFYPTYLHIFRTLEVIAKYPALASVMQNKLEFMLSKSITVLLFIFYA